MNVIYANLGAAAAAIIVLLLRRVLKKRVPSTVFAVLWLLVLIRVLIPVEAATHLSVFPAESALAVSANGELEHGEDAPDFVMPQFGAQADGEQQGGAQNGAQAEISAQSGRKMTAIQVLSLVHIGGAVLLALYFGFGHAVMLRRCNGFEHEKGAAANEILRCFDKSGKIALLVSTDACSPFSIGIIKPKIVLPPDCKAEQLRFVLAHEYVHIRDRDSVARLLGLAAVCAGWFNPFVWIAFKYLDRDLERFCDERALRLLGTENAPRYALTLLDFAERQMQSAAAQSFAAAPLEERVNDILNMKKRKTSMLAEAVLVAAALLAMTACGTAAYAEKVPPDTGKTLFCMERHILDGENAPAIKFEDSESGSSKEDDSYIWITGDDMPVGYKTVQEKYSVNHHFYRPITGEMMCNIGISLDYSFDGLSSKIDNYRIIRMVENGYVLSLTSELIGDTLIIDANCRTEDEKVFVHDVITIKAYPDSNVVKSHTDERTSDEEIIYGVMD